MAQNATEHTPTLQEREVHRYYQPWLAAHGSAVNIFDVVDSLAVSDVQNSSYIPRSSRDTGLQAFAQLAALRLNTKRSFISLIDSRYQYVLAEATKSLSLVDDSRHKEGDGLWLGSTIVRREEAICSNCYTGNCTARDPDGTTLTTRGMILPDCRLDDRTSFLPQVAQEPAGLRFYAGVPITTRSGQTIGVYTVTDDVPRNGLTVDELSFMQDAAAAIMVHLEWARDRVDRYKGARIVRGLANFIGGSPADDRAGRKRHRGRKVSGAAQNRDSSKGATSHNNPTRASSSTPEETPQSSRSPSPTRSDTSTGRFRESNHRPHATGNGQYTRAESVSDMLNRAALVLRESTLANGVAFFGSSYGSFGKASGSDSEDADHTSDSDDNAASKSCKVLGISLANDEGGKLQSSSVLSTRALRNYFEAYPQGKFLHFSELGFSVASEDETPGEVQDSEGKDKSTHGQSHTENEDKQRRTKRAKMSHTELIAKLPGVKNLIFLPLRDLADESGSFGLFLWSSTTGRMLSLDDDLSYLRAFAKSIMSEAARINALKDDRAKTTFIASMSHELRSPLHGMLGSVEFLEETVTDNYQSSLISSIATCGKTLLETLDHVLDHAKINKLGRARLTRSKNGQMVNLPSNAASDDLHSTGDVDLGVLVEEVVEAVCTGYQFKKLHSTRLTARPENNLVQAMRSLAKEAANGHIENLNVGNAERAVTVLLDISPRLSWFVKTQSGAVRRIVMNLLGNALKYTDKGFVAVSLRAQEIEDASKIRATIKVVDSGKGISEDYLRHDLFLPFSQEDSFQPGTGLGLSIVKQIVDSLGGTIDVKSIQGQGTSIEVKLNFAPAGKGIDLPLDDEVNKVFEKTKGLRLCILDPNQHKKRPMNDHIARLDTTLGELAAAWFGMERTEADDMDEANADFNLFTEPPSVEFLLDHHSKKTGGSQKNREVPLIIVCMNAQEAIQISNNHVKTLAALGAIVEVIPQPCGPRKLAKLLHHCLGRVADMYAQKGEPNPMELALRPKTKALGASESPLEDTAAAKAARDAPEPDASSEEKESYRRTMLQRVPTSSALAFPSPPPLEPKSPGVHAMKKSNGSGIDPSQSRLHVLLVDDNRINLQLLVMFMKKHNLSYEEAQNGKIALDKYKASYLPGPDSSGVGRSIDTVLMDISMPVMDGLESTRRIRQFEADNSIKGAKIVALTGLASAQAQQDAKAAGVDIYMAKPVKFDKLKEILFEDLPQE